MPKTGDEALRQWLNDELDKAAPHPDAPLTLKFVGTNEDVEQQAIKLATRGDPRLLRRLVLHRANIDLAPVLALVVPKRGGNRIKGLHPLAAWARKIALETALQERETALALLKQTTGRQREFGRTELVEKLVADRNGLKPEEVHHQRIRSRKPR